MNREQREKRWREICREFRESGKTRKAFCESHGIAESTLGYWLRRVSEPPLSSRSTPAFVPVGDVEVSRTTVLRIRVGATVVAELELRAEETVIRDVLKAAASL
jgi:transposase-like protein